MPRPSEAEENLRAVLRREHDHRTRGAPDQDPIPPLTDEEIAELRATLQQNARVKWLWASIRTWLVWVSGISVAIIWFKDSLKAGLKAFLGQP